MSDLLGGAPATSNGNGQRPTEAPAQTGSPQIRGPRMIMRERLEREARQKAEREQMERIRAEEEVRLHEETRRRVADRRASAAGAGQGGDTPLDPQSQRRRERALEAQGVQRVPNPIPLPSTQQQPTAAPPPLRPTRVPTSQTPQGIPVSQQPGMGGSGPAQTGEPSTQAPGATRSKNSFPHAFERWEALSAHWEGMTGFWIRKMQESKDEIDRDPISAQLSRQVADLSAAGANLFHAVVELQRLRASSERKFQRWFFETRADLERNQEVTAMLEAQMEQERQARSDAVREAQQHERENAKTQKLLAEMRKELLISKEEARRAWEELGRREQEEREKTVSLQQGHPTLVGGVQVVPMTQGVPSRQTSTTTRDYQPRTQATDTSDYIAAQVPQYPEYTQAPAVQPSAAVTAAGGSGGASYYQQPPEATGHEAASYGPGGSEAGYSEEDYEAQTPASQAPTSYPPSSSQWAGAYTGAPEYSGQGYAAPGWETMPRHHHPTRLSDVIEEDDERSRTSASQVSRA
ncbi:hypothetical protein B0T26DRAFT_286201 [Lasiosphaeria miniovina]|uniref:Uncharacterized protein n=1 Tax=Lasiosphaeria miniovina TaxID=1954250 RepID=A0AA40AK07_9PEZI|nr:uncharacterized protein B0T26DRAFT_286201 [Lasiosphaeria miniovina]KAK0717180.1 hypothetical protein B0T26DRAFT_286201 [Lasiosphaeria miniovina]